MIIFSFMDSSQLSLTSTAKAKLQASEADQVCDCSAKGMAVSGCVLTQDWECQSSGKGFFACQCHWIFAKILVAEVPSA